ncbi:neprilysin-4-like [Eupeodes corollae]|uniref:neprilysin-4-like n=1 Tax=Eupeodes corollae TaxID=290404 RepID=UPI002490ABBC|nr:neprilysin-4-like [Eupeodes corollae]
MTSRSIEIRSVIFLIFFILHQISSFQVPVKRLKSNDLHKFRIPRADKMRRYMNDSVDPCFDFYEFACGNWQSEYPATQDNPSTSPMKDLEDTVIKELQVILEDGVRTTDGKIGRLVKDFYASCMDSESASQTIKGVFSEFVHKNLGMPAVADRWDERNYNWVTQVSNLRKQYGMDILIGLNIRPDLKVRQDSRIYIGEPSTLIPRHICREGDFKHEKYVELEAEIADNMAYWFNIDKSEGTIFANNVLNFETNLCRGMAEEEGPDVFPNTTRMTLYDLNATFPSMKFINFVTTSLGHSIHQTIYLQHGMYFAHLSKLLPSTSKRLIANYIMYRALNAISFPEQQNREKRATMCVEKCMQHFSKAVGEMFSKENFHAETQEEVEQLWINLTEAFKNNIASQLWIEETTRRQAVYKINKIKLKFPNYYQDYLLNEYGSVKIDKKHFWQNILNILELEQKNEINKLYANGGGSGGGGGGDGLKSAGGKEVEAFNINVGYSPSQNTIRIPLGLLQPPVYHRTAPFSYKFGILGYFIARELVHGFDENGWNFDDASALRLWWDSDTTVEYKERATCFREQYVSYAGEDSGMSAGELDENIREIIAGNGALNISFHAYLQWLQKTDDPHILYDETLSEVDYTNTQLFFISFAQNFCSATYSEEEPVGLFPWDVPNYMEKFDVNGLLWNMKEFSREFNCLPGTEMNPGDKCAIY